MKYAILVKITGGNDHGDMCEDRSENLMDQRSRWNVSFQLEEHDKKYCIAAELVTRTTPDDKVLSSGLIDTLQNAAHRHEKKKWWKTLIDTISQLENKELAPGLIPGCTVWRLGGRPHCWQFKCESAIVFAEYDAYKQQGYALITSEYFDFHKLIKEFPQFIQSFEITDEDVETLCSKW